MLQLKLSKWLIVIAVFISVWPSYLTIFVGGPMYIIGVILYWTTKEHIIDKVSWTVLPILIYIVLVIKVYSLI